MSAVFEEKLPWPGGHPLSTHGPTVKDHDAHLSTWCPLEMLVPDLPTCPLQ